VVKILWLTPGNGLVASARQRRGLHGARPRANYLLQSARWHFSLQCFPRLAPDHRASGQRRGMAGRCRGERAENRCGDCGGICGESAVQTCPKPSCVVACRFAQTAKRYRENRTCSSFAESSPFRLQIRCSTVELSRQPRRVSRADAILVCRGTDLKPIIAGQQFRFPADLTTSRSSYRCLK